MHLIFSEVTVRAAKADAVHIADDDTTFINGLCSAHFKSSSNVVIVGLIIRPAKASFSVASCRACKGISKSVCTVKKIDGQ